ncbi:hypothetical protein AB0K02_24395 [Streptomyces sp. NPDC049597]|uniref:hypothetical protein n=1 Tax=Streptomyces sp. NPDC049597 TaxID=3155276 RepID=UPI00344730DD
MTDAASTDAPAFDPYDFPPDLIRAQREAAEVREQLHRFQATLPWSREPHEGWEASHEGGGLHGFQSSRPPTDGWTDEQKTEYDRLWEESRRASEVVYTHPHWQTCGVDAYKARQALKRVPEAQPVIPADTALSAAQEDVALAH